MIYNYTDWIVDAFVQIASTFTGVPPLSGIACEFVNKHEQID